MAEPMNHNHKRLRNRAVLPKKAFRERFLHKLPFYTGAYSVGYMDVEVPVRNPRPVSDLKRDGKPVLRLDTVLMGIYYPCDLRKEADTEMALKNLRRVNWMPRPRYATARGYAKYLNLPVTPVTGYLGCTTLFTKLPAFRNAHICRTVHDDISPAVDGPEKPESSDPETQKFPVIIFSHGLGGSRLCYSTICGELASHGCIVIALEHRDGSGARTHVSLNDDANIEDIISSTAQMPEHLDESKKTHSKKVRGANKKGLNPYYIVDYILPKDNAQDTSPNNPRGVDLRLRSAQIELRQEEIKEAFYVLELLNAGRGDEVAALNLRKKGNVGSSSLGLDGVRWEDWADSMYLDKVTAMGHSFGGATTVQLCRDDSLTWLGQGVILDAWGQATPAGGETRKTTLTKPIMAISSEAFMHWKDNYDQVVGFCKEARDNGAPCWLLTLAGSTHLAMTDMAVLYPHWMTLLMKSMVDPERAVYLTTAVSLEFMKTILPSEQTKHSLWASEHILETDEPVSDPDEAMRSDNAPDQKWVAVRLKIPNELSTRFIRAWHAFRRLICFPPSGKKDTDGDWEEIWTHFSPEPEHLQRYQ